MSTELEVAIIGAIAVGFLSLIANVVRQAMWNRNGFLLARQDSRIAFLQTQISELYSPLLGYLYESETYYKRLQTVIAHVTSGDEQAGQDPGESAKRIQAVKARFEADYFEPLMTKVVDLICFKRHLIVEDMFPQYLKEIVVHSTERRVSRALESELGEDFDLSSITQTNLPRGAVKEVERTLFGLRSEYRQHLRTAGRLSDTGEVVDQPAKSGIAKMLALPHLPIHFG